MSLMGKHHRFSSFPTDTLFREAESNWLSRSDGSIVKCDRKECALIFKVIAHLKRNAQTNSFIENT